MPPSTMTSASEILAQVTPIAPKSIWRRAIHGDLWPFEWGRQSLPPAAIADDSRSTLASNRPRSSRRDGVSSSAFGRPMSGSVAAALVVATGLPADVTAPGPCDPASAIVDCRQSPHMETAMEVVASGAFWDARTAPVNERSASSTSAVALADGTVLATCRLGHGSRGRRRPHRGVRLDRRRRRRGSSASWGWRSACGTAGRARRAAGTSRSWRRASSSRRCCGPTARTRASRGSTP